MIKSNVDSERARPPFPPLYTLFPLSGMGRGRGNDEGITGSLRYKHDEGNEEDISLTGVGVHTKLDAIFFARSRR